MYLYFYCKYILSINAVKIMNLGEGETGMGDLLKLNNIGKVLEEQLNEVGITSYEELKSIGSKEAWLRIKSIDPSECIHRLYALEGAIEGIKKSCLSQDKKNELREFYNNEKL